MKKLILLVGICLGPLFLNAAPTYSLARELTSWKKTTGSKIHKLETFYQLYWNYQMMTFPEMATYHGVPGQNDRWTDHSIAALEKYKQDTREFLKAIKSISMTGLKNEDLMNYRLFVYAMEENINSFKFPSEYMTINQMGGLHSGVAQLMTVAPKKNLKDYQDMITRLKTFPVVVDQDLILLKEGLKKGLTPPQITLRDVPAQFDKLMTAKIEDSPLYEAFKEIQPEVLSAEQARQVQSEAQDVLTQKVFPALKKYKEFLAQDYIPHARQAIGWSTLPDGKNWYDALVKMHTTVDMSAEQIHQLGLKEVDRIQNEMAKVRDQLKFQGSAQKFNASLSDSKFFFKTGEELLERYRSIGKRIDPELPKLFEKLPRLPYGIKEIPPFMAPSGPAAYYEDGNLKTGRPGYFYANTYDLKSRPQWAMVDLTCHEAVPGHHFQITIAKEMEGLPEFRKNMGFTSYSEGWALYAETLCDELGLYQDPYDKYGHLTAELMRSVRLVVDTGIHAKGWTRDQVVKYFREAGPFQEQEIQSETDRYIVWPGQALGYKIGQIKFKELREKLKSQLGENFNVRKFHDELLNSGSLPLPVLEKKMAEWGNTMLKHPQRLN